MKKVKVIDTNGNKPELSGTKPGEFDPHRKWNNGHKCLNSQESRALTELLNRESSTQHNFHLMKDVIRKARNPLNGEPTPRDNSGSIVLNPNAHGIAVNSKLLFNETNQFEVDQSKFIKKIPTSKIGINEDKYNVLGNNIEPNKEIYDVFLATKQKQLESTSKRIDEDAINQIIVKEKIRRYELNMVIQYI